MENGMAHFTSDKTTEASNRTVGDYVVETPSLSNVFERFGIDYCCGGQRPLAVVCKQMGLVLDDVIEALEAEQSTRNTTGSPDQNWQHATISELIDHIVDRHHRYLYENLPQLDAWAAKVARVHGHKDPRLIHLARTVTRLNQDLVNHLHKEEEVLFVLCRQLETADRLPRLHCGPINNPIHMMEIEHDEAGLLLGKLKHLTDNYIPPDWACNTYRALLDGLEKLEADLHEHIHLENNLLFPKTLQQANHLA
ncbi:MAG: iron-sulfur cluster repair di-iron protein [Vampirovibrionales bacterium]